MSKDLPGTEFDVDVLLTSLRDFGDLSRFSTILSDDEKARARAYRVEEPRDVFTLARGLLRIELCRRLSVPADTIHFELRPSGKPDLRGVPGGRPDWRFSVSHTGPHVAIAFARGFDLGIDIERPDRRVNPIEIAKRYFTPEEFAALQGFPRETRGRAFFAGWTRKEAIVKARGQTMAESLATLAVDVDPRATHPRYQDSAGVSNRPVCGLTAFESAEQGLIGAVAILAGTAPRLRLQILSETSFD